MQSAHSLLDHSRVIGPVSNPPRPGTWNREIGKDALGYARLVPRFIIVQPRDEILVFEFMASMREYHHWHDPEHKRAHLYTPTNAQLETAKAGSCGLVDMHG